MSIWRRLFGVRGKSGADTLGTTANPSATLVNLFGGGPTAAGVSVNDASALRVSAVYACVRVISEDIAKLVPKVWQKQPDGSRLELTNHPLAKLLARPHRLLTTYNLLIAMGAALGFRGNAIAVILRDANGRPSALWPVHPGGVSILYAPDGRLFYAISRRSPIDVAMLRDVPMMVPDYDIVHVRGMAFDGVVGLSPMAQVREDIGVDLAGQQMSGAMLRNGAQVVGVLKHPNRLTDPDVIERLRQQWRQRYAGPSNAGETIVLEEGMGFEKLGMTSVDAQFIEQRKLSIEAIARGFRVPLHMIGVLDRMTNNNVDSLTRAYYDQTLMPLLQSFELELARAFNLPPDIVVEFDVKRLLRADFGARQVGNRTMFQSGSITPNEWRISEDYPPTPAGDVFARPLNTAYVDRDGKVISVTPPGGSPPPLDDPASANPAAEDK